MYRFSTRSLLLIVVLLLIPITLLFRLNQKPAPSAAAWWNETWAYRRSITITNSGSAQNNVYITLSSLDTSSTSRFQSDGGDIRATKQDGTLLDYYIVSGIGTTNTTLHINFDTLIAGSSTIYLYYGNPSAANGFSASDFSSAAASSSPGTPATEESSPGPILYYSFDEGIGTSVSNSGIGGTITGIFGSGSSAPTWTDGRFGKALSFDGSSDYLDAGTSPSLNITTTITISVWIKQNSWSNYPAIVAKGYATTGGYSIHVRDNNSLWFELDESNGTRHSYNPTTTTPTNNSWTHIATTYDGTTQRLFINGVQVGSGQAGAFTIGSVNNSLQIGRLPSWGYFNGLIDELKIYSRSLSADEITQEYNRTASTQMGSLSSGGGNTAPASASSQQYCIPGDTATCSPPIAEWKFDEGIGTTAYDTSGNSNHTAFTAGSSAPTWTTGKTGKGLSFDGSNDYVYQNSPTNTPSGQSARTISAWIKPTNTNPGGVLVAQNNSVGTSQSFILMLTTISGTTYLFSDGKNVNNNITISGSEIPSSNSWHYISFVFNGSSTWTYYLDGVQKKTGSFATTINTVVNNIEISRRGDGANTGYYFPGQIDNVRIYNYARTPGQIILDMTARPPVSSPLLHFKFDEGYGTSTSNSGIGGTLTGTFGTGSSAPTWTDGRFGKGLTFGGNDYLSASGFVGTGSNPYTISCWLKVTTLNGNYQGCFALGTASALTSAYIGVNNANVLGGGYYTANLATNVTPTIGQWYHLVQTYSGGTNGHTIIYVDGVAKVDSTTTTPNLTTGTYAVGYIFNPYWFLGSIDEIKYYNYALTPDEIKQDYNRGTAFQMGSLSSGTGNTASPNASSQEYCVPGDTATCSPPVAEWKFDEGVGSTTYDTSGNSYHAVFGSGSSAPTWAIGKIGKGLTLNGSTQYATSADTNFPSSNTARTVEAWFKTSTTLSANDWDVIFSYGTASTNQSFSFGVSSSADADCPVANSFSASQYGDALCGTTAVNNGQWHHGTVVYNGSNYLLYVDGQLQKSGAMTTSTINSGTARIGQFTTGNLFFTGYIDQIRLFNYARTPAQIAWDYNRGDPVGHWKMDDCQGTQIADWSSNANHGTLSVGASGTQNTPGTCQVGTSAAWTAGATGKWNSSLNFDGTDDYVNISGSSSTLQITGDITISSWVKTTNTNYQITIDDLGSSPFTSWCQWLNPSGNIVWYDNSTWRASTRSVNDGQWHHIVTVVSNNTLSYYIDGKVDPSTYSNISARTATSDSKRIGTRADGISYPFRGQLDDIRVYNYAMTTTQIKQLYNNGAITFN